MSFTALRVEPVDFTFYIGLRDVTGNNRDYKWTRDGDDVTFAFWADNQPNDASHRCVRAFANQIGGIVTGQLDDVDCNQEFGALCETDKVSHIGTVVP